MLEKGYDDETQVNKFSNVSSSLSKLFGEIRDIGNVEGMNSHTLKTLVTEVTNLRNKDT